MSNEDIKIKFQVAYPELLNQVAESVNRFKTAIEEINSSGLSLNVPSPFVLRGLSGLRLLHPYRGTLRPGMFVVQGRLVDSDDYYRRQCLCPYCTSVRQEYEQGQADAREFLDAEYQSDFIGDLSCINNARCPQLRCAVNPFGPCEGCSDYLEEGS